MKPMILHNGCRIISVYSSDAGGWRSPEEKWPEIQDNIIEAMGRLERALKPHIATLKEAP
jgi:hypothetical protein